MRVRIGRERDLRVAENLLYEPQAATLGEEKRRAGVALMPMSA